MCKEWYNIPMNLKDGGKEGKVKRDVYARMGKRIHILMNTNLNPEFGYAIPNRGAYLCFSPMPTWIGKQPIQLVKTT